MSPSHEKWRIPSFQKFQTCSNCMCPESLEDFRHWIEVNENRPRKPRIPAWQGKGFALLLARNGLTKAGKTLTRTRWNHQKKPKTFWKLEALQLLTYPLNVETLKLDKSTLNMLELKFGIIPAWSVESKGVEHLASKLVPNFEILGCTFGRRRETQTNKGPLLLIYCIYLFRNQCH